MKLVGRCAECGMLDRLAEAVCAGQSRALVLCGEPGVGKTAFLQYLTGRAAECRVAQTAGVESEMELLFAGLHQLCAPLLAGVDWLPERQGDALRIVFGMSSGRRIGCWLGWRRWVCWSTSPTSDLAGLVAASRGGLAAAAAFLERVTMLTLHPEKRAEQAAASAPLHAGAFDAARDPVSIVKALAPSDFQPARIELIEVELAFATTRGGDAPQRLLKTAQGPSMRVWPGRPTYRH